MSESMPKGSAAIAFVALVYASIVAFKEGLRILRGGTLKVTLPKQQQFLAFVHLVNVARGILLRRRLIPEQLRAYGVAYIVVGVVGIITAAYALYTLLQ